MAFWSWSRTAGSNATADSTINWAEGQAPSSVNDSSRAMMARTAEYRDDISGAIVTGGTSTAYTVTSYEVFDTLAHMANQMIAFTPHTTNGATVTLNVDGLGAKPLRTSTGVELLAGTLIAGTPYVATYNNSDAVWYLRGFFGNPYNVPLGGGMLFIGTTAPNSAFVFPYGQAINRTTYATLFALTSTAFGVGDGSTTFNLPDLRGRTVAGKDDMGGSAASRLTASWFGTSAAVLGAVGGTESKALSSTNQIPQFIPAGTVTLNSLAFNAANIASASGGGTGNITTGGFAATGALNLNSPTSSLTFAGTAVGSASPSSFAICQPTIVCNYIVRVI